jgi:hypothetical protein
MPAPEPLRWDMTLPNGQPLRWDMGPEFRWDGNVPASAYPSTAMTTENRISATLADADLAAFIGHINSARALVPFLFSVPNDERNQLAKFGDKSQAFDDKIASYEQQRPDFVPSFCSVTEANMDRKLRSQCAQAEAAVAQLHDDLISTGLVLGGDIADHDKAMYANIRLLAQSGVNGAQAAYDDLKQRYPAPARKPATPPKPNP